MNTIRIPASEDNIVRLLNKRNANASYRKAIRLFMSNICSLRTKHMASCGIARMLLQFPKSILTSRQIHALSVCASINHFDIECECPLVDENSDNRITMWQKFSVLHLGNGSSFSFRIVPGENADLSRGLISEESDLAKLLLGAAVGDIAKIRGNEFKVTMLEQQ